MKKTFSPADASPASLTAYLSPLAVWALAFGCAVGWGAFIMPGTTFLPMAGPLGTALAIAFSALVMGVIALNYHFLMQHHPDAGGAYAYVKELCNHDHAFLCAWFLVLTYAAIVWANATALVLIPRNLFGPFLQFGFHYNLAGFDVWLGEILVSIAALLLAGTLLSLSKRWSARILTFLALVLLGGVALALVAVLRVHEGGWADLAPAFAAGPGRPFAQIMGVMALAPWAFVGFESISHSVVGFRFKRHHVIWPLAAALATSAFAYIALAVVATALRPEGFADWRAYIAALPRLDGVDALPVFNAIETAMGPSGVYILAATTLAAILTGLLGFLTAASRLVVAVARDGFFPRSLAVLGRNATPVRAVWALVAVSCFVPFVGRTAIGWIVDVTTIGASVAYAYVSWCTFASARHAGRPFFAATGIAGIAASFAFAVYCLVPHLLAVGTFSTESYLILALWGIFGALVFRHHLVHDATGRLGKSAIAWLVLLCLVFFTSHMWVRQATYRVADEVVIEVGTHYAAEAGLDAPSPDDPFLVREEDALEDALTRYYLAQMTIVVLALLVLVGIYTTISRRERAAAKAKEYFFSTVSHDIRTPLNAIVGYTESLRLAHASPADREEALTSILSSSSVLLRIVDDILDLSRLESGIFVFDPVPADCAALVRTVAESFAPDARKAGLDFSVVARPMPRLLVDPARLRQIVSNLVGNAVKFTQKGFVQVRVSFVHTIDSIEGDLLLEVEDTGIGIAEEDIPRITTAYVQHGAKLARNGGTGVGLAICRQLATAMGGTFTVRSILGQGTTFTIAFPRIKIAEEETPAEPAPAPAPTPFHESHPSQESHPTPPSHRILLVDDSKMNLMVLKALLKRLGTFDIATAADGNEALALLRDTSAPPFALVLTDYWMPNLDGAGLVSAIRSDPALSSLPVHVVTADIELQSTYASQGFDSLLLKPVTPDALRPLLPA